MYYPSVDFGNEIFGYKEYPNKFLQRCRNICRYLSLSSRLLTSKMSTKDTFNSGSLFKKHPIFIRSFSSLLSLSLSSLSLFLSFFFLYLSPSSYLFLLFTLPFSPRGGPLSVFGERRLSVWIAPSLFSFFLLISLYLALSLSLLQSSLIEIVFCRWSFLFSSLRLIQQRPLLPPGLLGGEERRKLFSQGLQQF